VQASSVCLEGFDSLQIRQNALGSAGVVLDDLPRSCPQFSGTLRICQESINHCRQLRGVVNFYGRIGSDEKVSDLSEILHMRSKDHRLRKGSRLKDIVSASGHQRTSDENHARMPKR